MLAFLDQDLADRSTPAVADSLAIRFDADFVY
jgi:hypothetical protein